ncbi:hypothetical protein FMUAM8_03650 [Nocardia cyriacigeorgica]|nr:hypothetical protein FMUAM8_03650 [Nocardia cyriacigeorgica]
MTERPTDARRGRTVGQSVLPADQGEPGRTGVLPSYPTAADILRRHWCTPGCIAAVSGPRGCRCACRGRYHGQAATMLLTNMTGGAS